MRQVRERANRQQIHAGTFDTAAQHSNDRRCCARRSGFGSWTSTVGQMRLPFLLLEKARVLQWRATTAAPPLHGNVRDIIGGTAKRL
jgi:hypothetical protein